MVINIMVLQSYGGAYMVSKCVSSIDTHRRQGSRLAKAWEFCGIHKHVDHVDYIPHR